MMLSKLSPYRFKEKVNASRFLWLLLCVGGVQILLPGWLWLTKIGDLFTDPRNPIQGGH